MALDIPKELRLAPWRQSQGYPEEVTVERRVVHDEVTFERRVRVVSRFTPTIHPPALPHEKPPPPPPPTVQLPALPREKPPPPPPPTSSRVPPPPPPPRRLEAGCKKAMAMASPAKPKLMPTTARAMLGLAPPLPKPKLPASPHLMVEQLRQQHQEQPLGSNGALSTANQWQQAHVQQQNAKSKNEGEEKESRKDDGWKKYDDWKPKDGWKTTDVWSKSRNGNQYHAQHSAPRGADPYKYGADCCHPRMSVDPMQLSEVKEPHTHKKGSLQDSEVLEPETDRQIHSPKKQHRSRSRAPGRMTHRSTRTDKKAKGTKDCRERRRRRRSSTRTASGSDME